MLPSDLGVVALALLFVVPGFLLNQVKRRLVVMDPQTPFEELMTAVASSVLVVALVEMASRSIFRDGFLFVSEPQLLKAASTAAFWWRYVFVLAFAVVLGCLWALLRSNRVITGIVQRLGFRVGFTPGPWDQLFHRDNEWLRVHLADGKVVDGAKLGASSFPDAHELYLCAVTLYNADLEPISSPGEVFISAQAIVLVEHFTERTRGRLAGT